VSFSLKIQDGDLVPVGTQLNLVFGLDKLKQDLTLWMLEQFGGDRFHVTMGSILREFIGSIADSSARAEVQAEAYRVLQNYQALQLRRLKESPELLSASELLVSIDAIVATMSYDTISLLMKLRNGSNTATTIKLASSTQ
jgi:hypothetical protein